MTQMEFQSPPKAFGMLCKAAVSRKKGRFGPEGMPRFEAKMVAQAGAELAAYQALCGFEDNGVLPITFPAILAAPLHLAIATHSDFPLPAMGLVHASNRIVQHRNIQTDESLELCCWIEGHRQVGVGIEIDLMTRVHVGDELVWQSCSTVLSRAVEGDGVKRKRPELPGVPPALEVEWPLPADLGRAYARISKDYNPIHLFPLTAKLFGFKRQIAHGMCLLAKVAAILPMPKSGPVVFEVAFRKPVFLPSTVRLVSAEHQGGQAFKLLGAKDRVQFSGWVGALDSAE
jgi:acyl dehydratase